MRKKTKVTLQDIATRANLSVSAVSLALRDHPSISEESKKRIHQLRQEMGYRVINSISKAAASTSSRGTLGLAYCLIGESLQDEAYAPLAHGIIKGCREWQAQLAIEQLVDKDPPSEPIVMPTGEAPSGYILAGFLTDELVDYFSRSDKPVIVLGINPLSRRVSSVRPDLFEAARLVAERAIAEGYRNFVNITANLNSTHNIQFLQGVRMTLAAHGYSLEDEKVIIAPEYKLHDPKYLDVLAGIATEPTAILTPGERTGNTCASILYAKGWIDKLKLGIYSLRGSDAGEVSPLFKCLNLGMERLGHIAVDRLVQKISQYETYKDASISLVSPKGWLDDQSSDSAAH
ncbi:LacI family DNA-binding transcriptional regulator [soil metagenome]